MGRFARHLGKPVEVELEYEENGETQKDIIIIKPLPIDNLVEWLALGKKFQSMPKDMSMSEGLAHLDDEAVRLLIKIMVDSMKHSYPDEDEAEIRDFAFAHMGKIFPAILEANTATSNNKEALSRMEAFKNGRQQATTEPSDESA
jgi:hypothetical protein